MTKEQKEDFLQYLKNLRLIQADDFYREGLDMAISAISALSEELSEDGTLTVHISDGSKVSRVFVMGDNIFGGLYYPDSENKGEWIPVSKRLPEEGHVVYCQLTDGSHAILYVQDNWGQMEWVDGMMGTGTYDVIAWRELPENYKGESEDKE